jgi:hypothetical protein
VGALAVALGIGAAVASSPGIAWGDPNASDSSGASTSSTSNDTASTKSPSSSDTKEGGPTSGETSPTNETKSQQADDTKDPVEAADGVTTEPAAGNDEEDPKPNKPHRRVQANASARSAVAEQESSAESDSEQRKAAADEPNVVAVADAREPAQLATSPVAKFTAVQALSVRSDEPAEPSPPVHPASLVTEVVSSLLSAVGFNPLATGGGPATPPASPTLWTMLGWVRRELGHVVAPATGGEASAVATTSLVEPAAVLAATSVLGTQQQLTAEQLATETLNTLPMQLMKVVLRFGFMSAAQQQFPGGPDQANLDQLDAAVNEYAMGAAFQQQLLDSMNPTVVMQVAPPHTWYGQVVPGSRILYDNPDTIYRFMGVNGASSYVITGRFAGRHYVQRADGPDRQHRIGVDEGPTRTQPRWNLHHHCRLDSGQRSPQPSAADQ